MEKRIYLILFSLFILIQNSFCLNCEKVAELPEDFAVLLPDYDKLKQIHINNYFFISTSKETKLTISVKQKSIFKFLVIPKHTDINVEVLLNGKRIFNANKTSEMPLDYTEFDEISQGLVTILFKGELTLEKEQNLAEQKRLDEICDSPYMRLEILFENFEFFSENVAKIKREYRNLNDFHLDFNSMLGEMPFQSDLTGYRLALSEGMKFKYSDYKFHVFKEFNIELNDLEEAENLNKLQKLEKHKKYEIKLEVFTEFTLFGSMFFLLIREEDNIEIIKELDCLNLGKCILSEKSIKNNNFLHVVLTPGKYRLFLIDIQKESSYHFLLRNIEFIPISSRISILSTEEEADKYNCNGMKLPMSLDTDDQLNQNDNFFEISSEIITNMHSLMDGTSFTPKHDSMFRVTAFHMSGFKIDIKLYDNSNLIAMSHNKGNSNAMMYSLKANVKYHLELSYEKGMIDENKEKTCEKINLRLTIFSVEYYNRIFGNIGNICKSNLSQLDKYIESIQFIPDKKEDVYRQNGENMVFTYPNNLDKEEHSFYQKEFSVKEKSILINIDILSDFTSNLVIPMIYKKNDDSKGKILHRFEKMTYQEGSLKIQLSKGEYILNLITSKNQFSDLMEEDFKNNKREEAFKFFPKCLKFQIRIAYIVLRNSLMKNWDCNNQYFHFLPESLNNLQLFGPIETQKDHLNYIESSFLVPRKSESIKLKTHEGVLLKLIYEIDDKQINMKIQLRKNDKVLKTAKTKIIGLYESSQKFITYYLKPNSEYEIDFINESENIKDYYYSCKMFTMHLELISKSKIDSQSSTQCFSNYPKLDDIFYERIAGVSNSFYKYGTKSIINLFTPKLFKNKFDENMDLESLHLKNSIFFVKKTDKPFLYTYKFEVKASVSSISVQLQSLFDQGMSIYISKITENKKQIVGTGYLIGYNMNGIEGLSLEYGQYELSIIESNFNKSINNKFPMCIKFSLIVLLENRPYDHFSKALTKSNLSCPYLLLPESLSIPGLISTDTNFTINEILRFKLTEKEQYTRFYIPSKSYFKFFIPNSNNNIYSYFKLMKETKGKRKKIIEKSQSQEIDINLLLDKRGTYTIQLYFKGVDDSILNEAEGCKYYEFYLSVMPLSNLNGNLDNFSNCKEINPSEIQPNTDQLYNLVTINKNLDQENIKEIKLHATNRPHKFLGELIYNNFLDSTYKITVLKNEKNIDPIVIPAQIMYYENFIWMLFHTEPESNYSIRLTSNVYHSSICSNFYWSYTFHDIEKDENLIDGSKIENEKNLKEDCKIKDHLPSSFYKNDVNLEKFGGLQGKDGSLRFSGEFLIPNDDNNKRASFIISKKSILYVKFEPNYEHNSNSYIQIFRDRNLLYRYGHNEVNGILLIQLNDSEEPYYLDLIFDKTMSNDKCESYHLIVNIIPQDIYLSEVVACEDDFSNFPDQLTIMKSEEISFLNFFGPKSQLKFKEDDDKNMVYETIITLEKSFSITMDLRYVVSGNMMDIVIKDSNGEVLEKGKEKFEIQDETILTSKNISVKLRQGKYTVKLIFRSFFLEMIKRIFSKKINNFCYNFKVDINAVKMDLKNDHSIKNNDETTQDVEENETSSEINKLEIADIEGNNNFVNSIEPPSLNEIRFKRNLNIAVSFAFDLENVNDPSKFKKVAYLVDQHNQINVIEAIKEELIDDRTIEFEFDVLKFETRRCYLLRFNLSILGNNFKEDGIEHVYCTTKCDCNKFASFKCSKNNKCKCHSPYTGEKCSECEKGFKFDGKYCQKEYKCDDKVDCSGHGKCDVTSTNNINCICDEGFESYGKNFCNKCSNPVMRYPYCLERMNTKDNLSFNWVSDCKEGGHHLPENLYQDDSVEQNFFGGAQNEDGSINFHGIILVKEEIEHTLFRISEESIIRVFFKSNEINRAQISISKDEESTDKIAFSDGKLSVESFIVKLKKRELPYVLKIVHNNLKSVCTRYELKIVIQPIDVIFTKLKCGKVDSKNHSIYLPLPKYTFGEESRLTEPSEYFIPEKLILNKKSSSFKPLTSELKESAFFTKTGVLSSQSSNEDFVYNIEVDVSKHPVTFTSSIEFDFLTNDLELKLRDRTGHIIKEGDYIIPSVNVHSQNNDMVNSISLILEPGIYYLTIVQSVAANHLIQLINENKYYKKKNKCFDFKFHIQSMLINKEDNNIPTKKAEELNNRIVDVEPPLYNNIKTHKKFEIMITFEKAMESFAINKDTPLSEAFYLENVNSHKKINPNHCYIQGEDSKRFLLLFKKNVFEKDQCYILKYNLNILQSLEHWQKLIDDSPLVHKFCTKSCNCNPHTEFNCDENGKCICEEPYIGEGCYSCNDDHILLHYKCISKENCNNHYCNGNGKCIANINGPEYPVNCDCDEDFRGSKVCDKCTNNSLPFPSCSTKKANNDKIAKENKPKSLEEEFTMLEKADKELFDIEKDTIMFSCDHSIIPANLDSLGYIHLDGHMHINGVYSIKHILDTHYSTKFTLLERSHLKLYIEHSRMTHNIYIIISYNNSPLYNGSVFVGPSGIGSSSFIDVILDPKLENGKHMPYEILYFIKDIPQDNKNAISYSSVDKEKTTSECFNLYLEMQIITITEEKSNRIDECVTKTPSLFPPEMFLFDYHNVFYNFLNLNDNNLYTFVRDKQNLNSDTIYFHHDYFYSPDVIDRELILNFSVYSKFLDNQIGILLEIVEIPEEINGQHIDHKKLNAKLLKEIFKDVVIPICASHCFTAIKKFNSSILSKILPSDTFSRIWLFDLSPKPQGAHPDEIRKCVNYNIAFEMNNEKANSKKLIEKQENAICESAYLPINLNIRGFLGDTSYYQKWGFHILDNFRIDHTLNKGLVHHTDFTLDSYSLFRIAVFSGKVDSDVELYVINGNDYDMIARSGAKNFEDVIAIEIPPGKYMLKFKFFSENTGFHVCETLRMEFSIHRINFLQENIERMIFRNKNNQISQINIVEHIKDNYDLYSRDPIQNKYLVEVKPSFVIDHDDSKNYESSVLISDFSFIIEPQDSHKLELIAYVYSDFSYFDASLYLTEIKSKKTIAAVHNKNSNSIKTGPLGEGTYVFTIRYYRRLHYINKKNSLESVRLLRATYAEIEFNAAFINRSDDIVKIMTTDQYLLIKPTSSNKLSHSWFCRNHGSIIPKSLNSLRFLEFSKDMHILDTYIMPSMDVGVEKIKFILKNVPTMMLRVYVESQGVDIDLELVQYIKEGHSKTVAQSRHNTHFETIMDIIYQDFEYEIILIFKGEGQSHHHCDTFKMEIATEVNHNYACPTDNKKYALLTSLNPIPNILPGSKENSRKFFKYDSREIHRGDAFDSGYVYMLRSDEDKEYRYSTFSNEEDIDLKVEISYDFLQSPINIFLKTSNGNEKSSNDQVHTRDLSIIAFGEIFENRSSLMIRKLPKGTYSLMLFIPGLKSTFVNEKEVCSICDILVESKRSKNNDQDMLSLLQIKDDNLDIPVIMPKSLSNLQFYDEEYYINNHNYYYLTHNITLPHEINDFINFELKEQSIVKFVIENNNKEHPISLSISGKTEFSEYIYTILQPGSYMIDVKLGGIDVSNYSTDILKHTVLFFHGISPLSRINKIYYYNDIRSVSHQCISTPLPKFIKFEDGSDILVYNNDKIYLNRKSMSNKKQIAEIKLEIKDDCRFIAEIAGDIVLMPIKLTLKSLLNEWNAFWQNNIGEIDINISPGNYEIIIELEEEILSEHIDCILFGLNIHVFDIKKNIKSHEIYERKNAHKDLLRPKCQSSYILPVEILHNTNDNYSKITDEGNYFTHLPTVLYFTHPGITKNHENTNQINITLEKKSFIRITTIVPNPKEHQIIPKLKIHKKATGQSQIITHKSHLINHNMSERNIVDLIDPSAIGESYKLELVQEKMDGYTEQSESYQCPIYSFILMISSTESLLNILKCPTRKDQTLEYKTPVHEPKLNNNNYSEFIPFTYFTENQMSVYYNNDENVASFLYYIKFKIETKSFISIEIGYDHLISLFDLYFSRVENINPFKSSIIGLGTLIFKNEDEHEPLRFRKVLSLNVDPGEYIITISESLWETINRELHILRKGDNKIEFCLPFSYSVNILPQDEKNHNLDPQILSIFPSGKLIFIGEDEYLRISITLNKTPYNKKKQTITGTHNFMNFLNSFYLSERLTMRRYDIKNQPDEETQIYADKIDGSQDGKVWTLIFFSLKLKQGYDYEFKLKPNTLVDMDYKTFSYTKTFPIFRVELDRISQYNLSPRMNEIRGIAETTNSDKNFVEAPKKQEPELIKNEVKSKCGKHGVEIYDNIFKKWLCSCSDGFVGKNCDMCYGEIDKVTGICIIKDNDNEVETKDLENKPLVSGNNKDDHSRILECGHCDHGVCNELIGKCICHEGFTGLHCEEKILKAFMQHSSLSTADFEWVTDKIKFFLKILLAGLLIFIFYYYVRKYFLKESEKIEYLPVGANEFEMSFGSMRNRNRNRESEFNDDPLVDYEIKPLKNKKSNYDSEL